MLKNAETVQGTSNLSPVKMEFESKQGKLKVVIPVVLAPNVEHEDTGNEE